MLKTINHIRTVNEPNPQNEPNPHPLIQTKEIIDADNILIPGTAPVYPTEAHVHVKKVGGRKRQITAHSNIIHPIENVWKVLTDYDALADFLPSLSRSRRIHHPNSGIRVEQIGTQRFFKFNFSARVVLDLEESFPKEINFRMIEGDFKKFSGKWNLESYETEGLQGTRLSYTLEVLPKAIIPVYITENRLSEDIRSNFLAIHKRVAQIPVV
ncbi:cyclase/dehydrase-like protein [Richelia intracellularis HH01]|uniref:Cyclase/dehydrase-like protein n=1 Tax=Richelia intracellularis HH01 TaxID=1165094 RepID=M1WZ06_9NOST|nr:cyclase/dehydrase-like protein [Richelia intracellularis HH01]